MFELDVDLETGSMCFDRYTLIDEGGGLNRFLMAWQVKGGIVV